MHAFLACAVVLGLTGCGIGGRAQGREVAGVVERFYAAVEAGDGRRACDLLSQELLEQVQEQAQMPCAEAVLRLDYHAAPVKASHVFITNAQVRLANDELAFLSRYPEGWLLTAVACMPARGTAHENPADCGGEA